MLSIGICTMSVPGRILLLFGINAIFCCEILSQWINVFPGSYDYVTSKISTDYENCHAVCQRISKTAHLTKAGGIHLKEEFRDILCLHNITVWVEYQQSLTTDCHVINTGSKAFEPRPCGSTYPCLCQRRVEISSRSYTWKSDAYDWVIQPNNKTYFNAVTDCGIAVNGSLISFANAYQVLLFMNTTNITGVYWLEKSGPSGNVCMVVIKDHMVSLQLRPCDGEAFSICQRKANITSVLSDPVFVEMIRNMTVGRKTTKMALSKLSSARDPGAGVKIVGGTVGVLCISVVVCVVVVYDLKLCGKCKIGKPKTQNNGRKMLDW